MMETKSFRFHAAVMEGGLQHDVITDISHGNIVNIRQEGSYEIDMSEYVAVPSFVDIHTHGLFGIDSARVSKTDMDTWRSMLPSTGTMAFIPTLVSSDTATTRSFLSAVKQSMGGDQGNDLRARVLGARLEGPFISPQKKGAHNESFLRSPSLKDFNEIASGYEDVIRIVDMAPELDGAIDTIRHLASLGLVISIGHSNSRADTARESVDAGARDATHLFNAMRAIEQRDPGIAVEVLINSKVFAELINDNVHLSPEMIKLAVRSKGDQKIIGITDSISATMMPEGRYMLGDLSVSVKEGRCTLEGYDTIAGSILTMDRAFRNFISQGFSIEQAVMFLSTNPSKLLGSEEFGSIGMGKRANITILDRGYNVVGIIQEGKLFEMGGEGDDN